MAAIVLIAVLMAAAFLFFQGVGFLVLEDPRSGGTYERYLVKAHDGFSIGFIHSVNKSPLTDYYEIRRDGIYVVKTVYYGFGAGVQTELEEGQTLTYGEDGSMIVSGFDQRIPDLIYFVGTVSDHTLTLHGREISLRETCGKSAMVRFTYQPLIKGPVRE